MAWEIEQRLRCPRCHTRQEEWDEDRFAYHVDEYRCPGCERLDVAIDDWREAGAAQVRGLKLSLAKGPRPRPTFAKQPSSPPPPDDPSD